MPENNSASTALHSHRISVFVAVILMLRTWAVWHRNRSIAVTLFILLVVISSLSDFRFIKDWDCTCYVQVDLLVLAFVDEVFLQDFSGLFLRRPLRDTTYTNDPVSSRPSPRIDGCLYFLSNRLAFVNFVIVIISEFSMYKGSLRKICTDRMLPQ